MNAQKVFPQVFEVFSSQALIAFSPQALFGVLPTSSLMYATSVSGAAKAEARDARAQCTLPKARDATIM